MPSGHLRYFSKKFPCKKHFPINRKTPAINPCQDGIQLVCVCISAACHTSFALGIAQPRGTSHRVCGQTEPRRSKVLERVCCELSSGSALLSGPQSAQPPASLDLMEKSLNCGGAGGQRACRMRGRKRERQGGGGEEKGQKEKGKKKSGSTTMEKSESCSCASGRIATSSALNTHKHQEKNTPFSKGSLACRQKQ